MQSKDEELLSLKKVALNSIKNSHTIAAEQVKSEFKTASEMANQKNPQAAQQFSQAIADKQILESQVLAQDRNIKGSLSLISDTSTLSYYRSQYEPNMVKLMNSMYAPTTTEQAATQTTETRNTRNGQTQTTQNTNQNLQQDNSKMTNPPTRSGGANQQTPWTLSNTTNGVSQGQPTNSTRGGRVSQ